jgi:hypothetical protein
MDIWDWILERRKEYTAAGDNDRLRLTTCWQRAFPFREKDPDQAVALMSEGVALAEELGERWWTMLLNHWRLSALIHFKKDYRQAIELAVRNSLAAAKPENTAFPARLSLYSDLIDVYLGVDAEGYADQIRATLAYLDKEIAQADEQRYMLLGSTRDFHMHLGDFAAAEATVMQAMDLVGRDPDRRQGIHHSVFNISALCWIAYQQQDFEKMADAAADGEQAARTVGHQMELCEFLAWQAVVARKQGDELRARRLQSTANTTMSRIQMPPNREYPDAMVLFHELGGDLDKALQVRDRELAANDNLGRLAYLCEVRVKRCTLLAKMGRLQAADVDAARQAAQKLRKPERWLAETEKLKM